jgi:hypothetical protein
MEFPIWLDEAKKADEYKLSNSSMHYYFMANAAVGDRTGTNTNTITTTITTNNNTITVIRNLYCT